MSEQRIKELDAEIMLKGKQIAALAADMMWADGGAYGQMKDQLQMLQSAQNAFLYERHKLTEHTVEIPQWIEQQRFREQREKEMKERIVKVLDKIEQKLQNTHTDAN